MTYNTRHALGSSDARDLKDNAEAIEYFANGPEEFYPNRFGEPSKSIKGLQKEVSDYILASGFEPVHLIYSPGTPLSVARATQLIDYSGSVYRVKMPATFPVALTGVWATDSAKLVDNGDQALRQALAGSAGGTMVADGTRTLSEKLSDTSRLQDQVPTGNGIADDLAKINAAISASPDGVITTGDKEYRVSTRPTNLRGARFRGKGRILLDTGLGPRQINTYGDEMRLHRGREYLSRAFVRMVARGQLSMALFGDSTIAGNNGEPSEYGLEKWLKKEFANRGYSNVVVENFGVSGTKIQDLNAIPKLGPSRDIIAVGYGTNNADKTQAAVDTYLSVFDSKLSAIRLDPNGSFAKLTIIIVGPNATNDIPNGRDYRFYEKIHWGLVELSKKHQAAYYNRYGECPDADNMAVNFLDAPPSLAPGVGIHPMAPGVSVLWGGFMEWAFPQASLAEFRTNAVTNRSAASGIPLVSAPARDYQQGDHTYAADLASGWPIPGVVQVSLHPDGSCIQRNRGYGKNGIVECTRTWSVADSFWSYWTGVAYDLAYVNGWAPFGSDHARGTVTVDSSGMGHVTFAMKNGTTAADTIYAHLPTGIVPAETFPGVPLFMSGGTIGFARYNTDGELKLETPGNAALTSGSFSFRVKQPA